MVARPLLRPFTSLARPLGTDALGRDVLAGLLYGAGVSLSIGLVATLISVVLGIAIGGIAGWYGGWIDDVAGRLTDVFQTMPFFVFALVIVALLSPSVGTVIFAIGVVTWPPVARLVRGEFLSLHEPRLRAGLSRHGHVGRAHRRRRRSCPTAPRRSSSRPRSWSPPPS